MKSGDEVEITDMYYLGKHPRSYSGVLLSHNHGEGWALVKLDVPYPDQGNMVTRQWFRREQFKIKEPVVRPQIVLTEYEITIEMPNGDWLWWRQPCRDFHDACLSGIQGANKREARLHHIEVVPNT
jgi:hypothetical protein